MGAASSSRTPPERGGDRDRRHHPRHRPVLLRRPHAWHRPAADPGRQPLAAHPDRHWRRDRPSRPRPRPLTHPAEHPAIEDRATTAEPMESELPGVDATLTLADWRRQISSLYAEVRRLSAADVPAALRLWRETRERMYQEHRQSPVPASAR